LTVESPHAPLLRERWFHTIDLPDGSSTPGVFDMRAACARLDWPAIAGRRCLDVGTCDGFWAFEMERRGAAEVVAIDVDDPDRLDLPRDALERSREVFRASAAGRKRRFEMAAAARSSRVRRLACSVYDLDPAIHGHFDVVFCGTLLVHLREPVRALERIAGVCTAELLLVECVDARLDFWSPTRPRARSKPTPLQWARANTARLHEMLRLAGFAVLSTSRPFQTPCGAGLVPDGRRLRPLVRAGAWARTRLAASTSPLVTNVLGLAFGTYDVAVRARPTFAKA
jgi:tRNA (mo5U34)-methyltransferase